MGQYRIGIDLGQTSIKIGLFDAEVNKLDSLQPLTDQGAELYRLMDQLATLTKKLLDRNHLSLEDLAGIGAAFPSYIDYEKGIVLETSYITSLTNAPVRDLLAKRLGVPVYLDNDCNCAALAEHKLGAGIGYDDMVYATLATGIGGGLILNGKLYRGMHGMAGEIGHMIVADAFGFPCICGAMGCVQSMSSGVAMAKYAMERIKEGYDSSILDYAGTMANIDMIAVSRAFEKGDELAREVVSRGAEYIARMFHSLNQILDINIFIYGGGLTKLGSLFTDHIISTYRQNCSSDQKYPAMFIPSKLGDFATMYGAALLIDH